MVLMLGMGGEPQGMGIWEEGEGGGVGIENVVT